MQSRRLSLQKWLQDPKGKTGNLIAELRLTTDIVSASLPKDSPKAKTICRIIEKSLQPLAEEAFKSKNVRVVCDEVHASELKAVISIFAATVAVAYKVFKDLPDLEKSVECLRRMIRQYGPAIKKIIDTELDEDEHL